MNKKPNPPQRITQQQIEWLKQKCNLCSKEDLEYYKNASDYWKSRAEKLSTQQQPEAINDNLKMELEKIANKMDNLLSDISQNRKETLTLRSRLKKISKNNDVLMQKITWIESVTKDRYEFKFDELKEKVVTLKKEGMSWREVYNKLKLQRYPGLKDRLKKIYHECTPENS
mgnify:CR=1 FL=1